MEAKAVACSGEGVTVPGSGASSSLSMTSFTREPRLLETGVDTDCAIAMLLDLAFMPPLAIVSTEVVAVTAFTSRAGAGAGVGVGVGDDFTTAGAATAVGDTDGTADEVIDGFVGGRDGSASTLTGVSREEAARSSRDCAVAATLCSSDAG